MGRSDIVRVDHSKGEPATELSKRFIEPAIPKTGSSFLFFLSLQWERTCSRSADDDIEQVLYMSANLAFHGEAAGDGFDGLDFCELYPTVTDEIVGDTLRIFQLEVAYNLFQP
jgi:hypothetical protein